jgi:hypothetical protein
LLGRRADEPGLGHAHVTEPGTPAHLIPIQKAGL